MHSAQINFKVKPEVKKKAAKLADQLGLSLSSLLNGYLHHFISSKSVYFSTANKSNNEEFSDYAIQSLAESEKETREGWVSPPFDNAEDSIAWLNNPKRKYVRDLHPEIYQTNRKSSAKN